MEPNAQNDGHRFEVLAAVTGAGAAAVFLGSFGQVVGLVWLSSSQSGGTRFHWYEILQTGSPSGNVLPAGLLALSLALVLLSPGPTVGRLGSQVLQGLRLAGAVVSLFALLATEEFLRRASDTELALSPGPYAPGQSQASLLPVSKEVVLLRVSMAAPFLAAAAMAAFVAWTSQNTLRSIPIQPELAADDESDEVTDRSDNTAEDLSASD